MSDLGDGQLESPNRWRRFTEECLPASESDGWMWRVSANGAPVEADLSMVVALDSGAVRAAYEASRQQDLAAIARAFPESMRHVFAEGEPQ